MGEEGLEQAVRRSREAASKCPGAGPPFLLAWCEGSEDLPGTDVSPKHPAPPCTPPPLPSIMVTGSSTCGRSILGPKTVARFWTLILLTSEWD